MLTFARVVFVLFALLMILGGIAGYAEKRSVMSLAAGILCGGLAAYGAFVLTDKPKLGLALALVGAILGFGGMMPRLKDKKTGEIKVWPAATVVAASALTALVAAGTLLATRTPEK